MIVTTQPILERLALRVWSDLGDVNTSYISNGLSLQAIQVESALNKAILSLYEEELAKYGEDLDKAAKAMAEKWMVYKKNFDVQFIRPTTLDSSALAKADYVRRILNIKVNTVTPLCTGIASRFRSLEIRDSALTNAYSNYQPTVNGPKYWEDDTTYAVYLHTVNKIEVGYLYVDYLHQPVYTPFSVTGPDVVIPANGAWEDAIVAKAKENIQNG